MAPPPGGTKSNSDSSSGTLWRPMRIPMLQARLHSLRAQLLALEDANYVLEQRIKALSLNLILYVPFNSSVLKMTPASDPLPVTTAAHAMETVTDDMNDPLLTDSTRKLLGNLMFLLQSCPRYLATLCDSTKLVELDPVLDIIMFTLFRDQFDTREEQLLLLIIQHALTIHITNADDLNTLMRANSSISRMLTAYCHRMQGQSYLDNLLAKLVDLIIQNGDLDLEINPFKLDPELAETISQNPTSDDSAYGTSDDGSGSRSSSTDARRSSSVKRGSFLKRLGSTKEDKKPNDLVENRVVVLADIVRNFLDIIIATINDVPFGIRWICKQIHQICKERFPDAPDTSISSLIGGFFMLRFLNPAIVSTDETAFKAKATENTKRTLTLVAKILQNVSNSKSSSTREAYMTPFFPFIESHKGRVARFFTDLCDVEDFEYYMEFLTPSEEPKLTFRVDEVLTLHGHLEKQLDVVAPDQADTVLRSIVTGIALASDFQDIDGSAHATNLQKIITMTVEAPFGINDRQSSKSYSSSRRSSSRLPRASAAKTATATTADVYELARKKFFGILRNVEFDKRVVILKDSETHGTGGPIPGSQLVDLHALAQLVAAPVTAGPENEPSAMDLLAELIQQETTAKGAVATTASSSPTTQMLGAEVARELARLERVLRALEDDTGRLERLLADARMLDSTLRAKFDALRRRVSGPSATTGRSGSTGSSTPNAAAAAVAPRASSFDLFSQAQNMTLASLLGGRDQTNAEGGGATGGGNSNALSRSISSSSSNVWGFLMRMGGRLDGGRTRWKNKREAEEKNGADDAIDTSDEITDENDAQHLEDTAKQ
ncbi:hypothetical protein HDU82_001963 [Entophlyctis luteolus]|nr:hypothetical protein HDU82_001963 [Entophlyctis luteolus]